MTGSRNGRNRGRATLLIALACFLLGLGGSYAFFSARSRGGSDPGATEPQANGRRSAEDARGSGDSITDSRRNALVRAAETAIPAVVSIVVSQPGWTRAGPMDLLSGLYELPFGGAMRRGVVQSIGSGFVVDDRGIILTNEHVVRGATNIEVIFSDGRQLPAKLVGADVTYDLAVLQVEPPVGSDPIPVATIGSAEDLLVGEWAIAIGNPFGSYLYDKQHTVTVGVISALHRDVKNGDTGAQYQPIYNDMIQTDAAINPGNSGGPLVNSLGEVIGINTFIFTQGGGSLGIGFATPINTAVRAARDIVQYGRVRHPNLGIYVWALEPRVVQTLRITDRRGLLINKIDPGSTAEKAGLQALDIIREIDGVPVMDKYSAQRRIFGVAVGDSIRFTVERSGRRIVIPVLVETSD